MIPKLLHFCWFGPNEVPDEVKHCLDTWREHMPEWQIREWRDGDLPNSSYAHAALKNGKYANVSNYVRLHALHYHGGVYLDTDIEVLKSFNPLLNTGMFAGWQQNGQINNAVLGAEAGHPFIAKCMLELPKRFSGVEKAHFSSPVFFTQMLLESKIITKQNTNQFMETDPEITLYPTRFFYPHWHTEKLDRAKHVTPDTYCIHHWAGMWK